MTIYAVDPGAVYTGVAWLRSNSAGWKQFDDPIFLWGALVDRVDEYDTVLVEDYSHGGTFTIEAKRTLKIVGFLEYSLQYKGIKVVMRTKDQRLSGRREAAVMMDNSSIKELEADVERKDAFSALSHVVTYRRTLEDGTGI